MIYSSYHSRLEISFCIDEFLKPPIKDEIEFEDDLSEHRKKNKPKELKEGEGNYSPQRKNYPKENENSKKGKHSRESSNTSARDIIANNIPESAYVPEDSAVANGYAVESDTGGLHKETMAVLDTGSQIVCDVKENSKAPCDNEQVVFQLGDDGQLDLNREKRCPDNQKLQQKKDRTSSFINISISSNPGATEEGSKRKSEVDKSKGDGDNVNESYTEDVDNTVNITILSDVNDTSLLSPNMFYDAQASDNDKSATKGVNSNRKFSEFEDKVDMRNPRLTAHVSVSAHSTPELRKKRQSGELRDRSPNTPRRSTMTQLTDNSDPLNNYQISRDESIFQSSMAFEEQLVTHRYIVYILFY